MLNELFIITVLLKNEILILKISQYIALFFLLVLPIKIVGLIVLFIGILSNILNSQNNGFSLL